jgi:hypothetical protein
VSRHCVSRASSGWADWRATGADDEPVDAATVEVWPRRERRVSWTPGAEGADVSSPTCVGCALLGTKRRDYAFVSRCYRSSSLGNVVLGAPY